MFVFVYTKMPMSSGHFQFLIEIIRDLLETSRGAGADSVTVNATGCGFDPHSME